MLRITAAATLLLFFFTVNLPAKTYKAIDKESYSRFLSLLQPGDTLLLANGTWSDFKIIFNGNGTATAPITLCAETPGKVIISGKSNLKLGGSYLVVANLLFKDGSSPDEAVISFRISEKEFAINSRVTGSVIDRFNKPKRYDEDNYVALWGRNNRVDHCYFGGKNNIGVTLEVYLTRKEDQENHHSIDHNYFGPRPRLGSNGGETMRVGTSEVSKQPSYTLIENNYFEKCNGETEVISIKACDNIIRLNTLFECEGGLVLRHGDRNKVYNNFFIGNGKPETAGIRVINDGHKIYSNYLSGLRGRDFRGPLVLMDGLPNSPLIRYHQVDHVEIVGNVWVNCEMPWHIGYPFRFRGDETKRVPPINTTIAWNVVYNDTKTPLITPYDEITGIQFLHNYTNHSLDSLTQDRMRSEFMTLKQKGDLMIPTGFKMETEMLSEIFPYVTDATGKVLPVFSIIDDKPSRKNSGPDWYDSNPPPKMPSAQAISINPGKNTLADAVMKSAEGDTILFSQEGIYLLDHEVKITQAITLKAAPQLKTKPIIQAEQNFSGETLLRIAQGGSLRIKGLTFTKPNSASILYAIASDRNNMSRSYSLFADHSVFDGFKGIGAAAIKGCKGTFADRIMISNSTIRNSTVGLSFNEETEDKGIYNGEFVTLENSVFENLQKHAVDLYRGGTDESTFGPFLYVDHCVFNSVGSGPNDSILKLTGVQHVDIYNTIFSNSRQSTTTVLLDGKYNSIGNSNIYNAGKIERVNEANVDTETIYSLKPEFTKDGTFMLNKNSALRKKGIGRSK